MKRLLTTSIALLLMSSAGLFAQMEPGIGIAYGFDVEKPGIEARLQIGTTDISNIRLIPAFTWFLTSGYEFFTIDLNLQYMLLHTEDGGRGWVIGGLDVAKSTPSVGEGTTTFGANLGLGGSGDTGLINPFAEAKYVFGDASQVVVTVGMFF